MTETLNISSKIGSYSVIMCDMLSDDYHTPFEQCRAAIVDQTVLNIYGKDRETFGAIKNVIPLTAREKLKNAKTCISLCEELLNVGFKRGETFLAIGGGTIQDIATFTASILYRGIPWIYIPTTLLAQADSCIGGKSSLNIGNWKNQIGNFYPPRKIYIATKYLKSLSYNDIRSGLGEILKVHFISGADMVKLIGKTYHSITMDDEILTEVILRSLQLKAKIIEADEFDQGYRLILNYGHSFGHAFEAATKFSLPHGIAITFGMDLANYLSWNLGRISKNEYESLNKIIRENLKPSDFIDIDLKVFFKALRNDKKNRPGKYCFVLPVSLGKVEPMFISMEQDIEKKITHYIQGIKRCFF